MDKLFSDIKDMQEGRLRFTLILTDPLARSFIQNIYHPMADQRVKRSFRKRNE